MANEIAASGSLGYNNPLTVSGPVGKAVSGLQANSTEALGPSGGNITILTSPTQIPLGSVISPGWAWFRNMDPTNYVQIMPGSGGAYLIRLLPGEFALFPLDSGAAPYAIANTAPIDLEYLITSR